MNQAVCDYIDTHFEEMKDTLAKLVEIPSVSGKRDGDYPFGEPCAKILGEFLKTASEMGFTTKNYDNYAGSVDYGEAPTLGILGHLDVVPVCEKDWASPPFEMREADRRLYGRGTIDDKGPVTAALFAVKAIKECGIVLSQGIRLIVGCTEETGTEADIKHYLETEKMPPRVFTPDGDFPVITTEKAMIHFSFSADTALENIMLLSGGTVINAVPDKAKAIIKGIENISGASGITVEKTADGFEITAQGTAAHASKPENGVNAITLLLVFLQKLRLSEGDLDFVNKLLLLFPHGETDGKAIGIAADDGDSATTCLFSIMKLENGCFEGKADIRCSVSSESGFVREKIQSSFNSFKLSFEHISNAHIVDENSDFVQTLLSAYSDITGLEPYCKTIGGGTYVHNIENGVAFGMEFPGESNNMHGADEFVSMESLKLAAKIYAEAILRLCG